MDQKVTINVDGRPYVLKASSPEQEERIRLAARYVSAKLVNLSTRFPRRPYDDILTFIALNECISRIESGQSLEAFQKEADALAAETEAYIAEAKKK